jgi:hypothetical protein
VELPRRKRSCITARSYSGQAGDGPLHLEQQLVVGVIADGVLQEDDLAPGATQLLQEQHLVRVLARQAVGAEHDHEVNGPLVRGVPEPVQPGPI